MKIGIYYATYSGGTETVSEILANALRAHGHTVSYMRIPQVTQSDLDAQDIILFGTPSWFVQSQDGQPHEAYIPFFEKCHLPTSARYAVFGLGDEKYPRFCGGAQTLIERIENGSLTIVYKPLLLNKYYFAEAQNNALVHEWAQGFMTAATAS